MSTIQKITPFLWFNDNAKAAADFYVSVFPNSKILSASQYGEGMPLPKGTVMTVAFELEGQKFTALNGGPQFTFSEAISFVVTCETQAEIDHYWEKLTSGGGKAVQCGWLKDQFGLSWQIVPTALGELMKRGGEGTGRMMQALMQMTKLDIAALQRAYDGR